METASRRGVAPQPNFEMERGYFGSLMGLPPQHQGPSIARLPSVVMAAMRRKGRDPEQSSVVLGNDVGTIADKPVVFRVGRGSSKKKRGYVDST